MPIETKLDQTDHPYRERRFPRSFQYLTTTSLLAVIITLTVNAKIASADGGGFTVKPPSPVTSSISIRPYSQRGNTPGLEDQSPDSIFDILEITEDGVSKYQAKRIFFQPGSTVGLEDLDPNQIYPIEHTIENRISSFRRIIDPIQPNP